jgi:uncharacterized membrane protein YbhN (UPF0104 family)
MLGNAQPAQLGPVENVAVSGSAEGRVTPRRIALSLTLFLAALAGTVLLCAWGGVTLNDAARSLFTMPIWILAAFTTLTVLQIALSAWKWRLVMRNLGSGGHGDPRFAFLYNCTALAAFLSQFLTVYLSSILVRGWALRRNYELSARYAAMTSLFEQIFDVIALSVMVVPTLLVWTFGLSFGAWWAATATAIAVGALSLYFMPFTLRAGTKIGALGAPFQKLSGILTQNVASEVLTMPFMLRLYGLSILRYLTMLVRIPLLAAAFGVPIAMKDAIPGFTIVQATQIAALTPGQLGIREWTWSGVLAFRGYDLQLAAQFAIDLRIVSTLALVLAALICIPYFWRKPTP